MKGRVPKADVPAPHLKDNDNTVFKFKIKALILFERIANKPFEIKTTEDLYLYFYCVRCVNIDDYSQQFDDFLDECDDNPELLKEFVKQFEQHNQRQNNLSGE
jgi:hypothetical protein